MDRNQKTFLELCPTNPNAKRTLPPVPVTVHCWHPSGPRCRHGGLRYGIGKALTWMILRSFHDVNWRRAGTSTFAETTGAGDGAFRSAPVLILERHLCLEISEWYNRTYLKKSFCCGTLTFWAFYMTSTIFRLLLKKDVGAFFGSSTSFILISPGICESSRMCHRLIGARWRGEVDPRCMYCLFIEERVDHILSGSVYESRHQNISEYSSFNLCW